MNRIAVVATLFAALIFCFMTNAAAGDLGSRPGPGDIPMATGNSAMNAELERDTAMTPPKSEVAAKRDEDLDWLLLGENAMKGLGWLGARWIARSGFNDGCLSSSDPRTISNLAMVPSYVAKPCIDNPFRPGYAPMVGAGTNLSFGFSGQHALSRAFDGNQKTTLEWATIGCDLAFAMRHRVIDLHFRF